MLKDIHDNLIVKGSIHYYIMYKLMNLSKIYNLIVLDYKVGTNHQENKILSCIKYKLMMMNMKYSLKYCLSKEYNFHQKGKI